MKESNQENLTQEGLVVEKDRILSYSNLICPLDCRYCFADDINNSKEKNISYLADKQLELLSNLPENIKTIMLGCDTEFFQHKDEAIGTLKKLSKLSKDISVITKLELNDSFVNQLQNISREMKDRGNFLVFSVSIPCFDSSYIWEPKAPSAVRRIDSLKRISESGIYSMVAIRPLIPNLKEEEIGKIVDLTNQYVFGYYSGPLYIKNFDNSLFLRDELLDDDCCCEEVEPNWMPDGNKFIKIENRRLMNYLSEKIKKNGNNFFEGAAHGVEFLRKK